MPPRGDGCDRGVVSADPPELVLELAPAVTLVLICLALKIVKLLEGQFFRTRKDPSLVSSITITSMTCVLFTSHLFDFQL